MSAAKLNRLSFTFKTRLPWNIMFKGKKPDLAQDINAISYSCFYLIS